MVEPKQTQLILCSIFSMEMNANIYYFVENAMQNVSKYPTWMLFWDRIKLLFETSPIKSFDDHQ